MTSIQQVATAIRDRGLNGGKIGVEMRHFQLGYALELQRLCPEVRLEDCEGVLDRIRAVKTPTEIEILRHAARVTDKALTLGLTMARIGDSEKKLRDNISSLLLRFGASTITHSILCSGERCKIQHYEGSAGDILEPGTMVATDYGGMFDGYSTDIARMAAVGRISSRQRDLYDRLAHVQLASIGHIKPGVAVKDLVALILAEFEVVGMPTNRMMFGHSIGVGVHDWPMITPHSDAVLEENMILSFENTTDDPDTGVRYGLENIILVTASGAERLDNFSNPQELIQID